MLNAAKFAGVQLRNSLPIKIYVPFIYPECSLASFLFGIGIPTNTEMTLKQYSHHKQGGDPTAVEQPGMGTPGIVMSHYDLKDWKVRL